MDARKIGALLVPAALLAACVFSFSATPVSAQEVGARDLEVRGQALRQIQALLQEKAARTPAQRKISSRLLHAMKRRRLDPLMLAVPDLSSTVEVARDGTTLVDIKAEVTDSLLRRIEEEGGRIVNSSPRFRAVRARIPLDRLDSVTQAPEVRSLRPADRWITRKLNTSQGDIAHRADLARSQFAVDGRGVKICALSDGVDALTQVQQTQDLPAVSILSGQAGQGSEGTAMLEIIHDLAPRAELGFATAAGGQPQFARNILDLRSVAGCDVIVDDIFYLAEPVFQDGVIAQAVDEVVADGAVYFSSAGNAGNLNDGTAGVWEGDYADSGQDVTITSSGQVLTRGSLHDFGGGIASNQLTSNAPFAVTLQWSDPLGASTNDYDLCVLDSTLTRVFDWSTDSQSGTQDPFEIIGPSFTNERLIVINFDDTAAPRFLHLNTIRGSLANATEGQVSGHAAAEGAFAVAAVDVATAGGGAFTGGAANPVEAFSSDGPRRIFFEADGTPITPGNFLSGGGTLRQKPDIAAADGVATATPDFEIFFGTSAAAPHAAAIAGLMLALDPALSTDDLRNLFAATALDIEGTGFDRDSGAGILDAVAALDAVLDAPVTPRVEVGQAQVNGLWTPITFNPRFQDPIVIAGPPTLNDSAPGVVRLRQVSGDSFQASFQEWDYLDGAHGVENMPYLVMERGRHEMPDGSIWEAGSFPLSGHRVWQSAAFSQPFPARPELFLTVQTFDDPTPVTVRARELTADGFRAALFEEEALADGHGTEAVGYLAVYSPPRSGSIATGSATSPYRLLSAGIDDRFTPILSYALKLEEEQSKDAEVAHGNETLSVLALGRQLFAQDVRSRGKNTIALRRLAPAFTAPMEWGTVDGVTKGWSTVPLSRAYTNPVVVAKPVSNVGRDPGTIRLRNVTGSSFQIRYQEWKYLDGGHEAERVFYMVAEAGVHSLAGLTVEARSLQTKKLLSAGLETVSLSGGFDAPPGVFASVQSYEGRDAVIARVDDVTASGFLIAMDEEEAVRDGHVKETLGWIAIERGSGTTSDGRAVLVSAASAGSSAAQVAFGQSFDRRFPVLLADVVSTWESDPVFPRYRNLKPSSVQLFLQEEQSLDLETTHAVETLSIFVAE